MDVTRSIDRFIRCDVEGNLDVNGTLTSVDSNNLQIKDQFILAASGSNNHDGGIIVNTDAGSGSYLKLGITQFVGDYQVLMKPPRTNYLYTKTICCIS